MKAIILYKSKYGSTKKYAEWLAEALNCPMAETGTLSPAQLSEYDILVFGGNIHASKIQGISWLKKHPALIQKKAIAVFGVGASPYNEKDFTELCERNLGADLPGLQSVPCFYLRGTWNEPNMTWPDRKLCGLLKNQVQKKPQDELQGWEAALLEAYQGENNGYFDWMSKDQLVPLINWAEQHF